MKTILFLLSLLSVSAFAQSYSFSGKRYNISYEMKEEAQEIRLEGTILSSLVEDLSGLNKVKKLLRRGVNITLRLNSHGGFQAIYNDFGDALKNACNFSDRCKITTYVSSASTCESACIPLFMIGDSRWAGRSATFGFHQATVLPGAIKIMGKEETDLYEAGVSKSWLDEHHKMFETIVLTTLSPEDLEGSNIITKIVE